MTTEKEKLTKKLIIDCATSWASSWNNDRVCLADIIRSVGRQTGKTYFEVRQTVIDTLRQEGWSTQ